MPLPTVHFLLARVLLRRWLRHRESVPFDVTDRGARNAYFHGALGPDMGLFPGGEPILSELAHTVRGDELTRTLVSTARTDVQRAFAYGWATHILADDVLHPIIDEHAALLLAADGLDAADPVPFAAAHARTELGLDIVVQARDVELRNLHLRPCFDALSINYLGAAYRSTYGLELNRKWLLRSHRAVGPLARALALLERVHALAGGQRPSRVARHALQLLRGVFGRLPAQSGAFLRPVPPTKPLLSALAALQRQLNRCDCISALGLGAPR